MKDKMRWIPLLLAFALVGVVGCSSDDDPLDLDLDPDLVLAEQTLSSLLPEVGSPVLTFFDLLTPLQGQLPAHTRGILGDTCAEGGTWDVELNPSRMVFAQCGEDGHVYDGTVNLTIADGSLVISMTIDGQPFEGSAVLQKSGGIECGGDFLTLTATMNGRSVEGTLENCGADLPFGEMRIFASIAGVGDFWVIVDLVGLFDALVEVRDATTDDLIYECTGGLVSGEVNCADVS
jgi:hypothetical protein